VDPLVIAQVALAAVQDVLFAAATSLVACGSLAQRCGMLVHAKVQGWRGLDMTTLALTALAYLWLQAAVISGSPRSEATSSVADAIKMSNFGAAWSLGLVGALLSASSYLYSRRASPLFVVGFVMWAVSKAATSHASDAGDVNPAEAIHAAHLIATAIWASIVVVATALSRQFSRASIRSPEQSVAFYTGLSHIATSAFVVVVVSGIYNVMHDTLYSDAPVAATHWGKVLGAKLACVALATALGGWNQMIVLPRLIARADQNAPDYCNAQRRFGLALSLEACIMLVVLTLAAILGHLSPAGA
jgi:copper resistance protein D